MFLDAYQTKDINRFLEEIVVCWFATYANYTNNNVRSHSLPGRAVGGSGGDARRRRRRVATEFRGL